MLSVNTYGGHPAQYSGTTGIPMFYGPWGNIVHQNGQEYYIIVGGHHFPVIPNPHLPYPYVIPSFF